MAGSIARIADVIRTERELRRLSQSELAHRSGVGRQWLTDLETGRAKNPSLGLVLAVLTRLDLTLAVVGMDAIAPIVDDYPDIDGLLASIRQRADV